MYLDASAFEVMSPPPIMKPTVYVVRGGSRGDWEPVERMFKHDGWRVVNVIEEASLVVFCGGSDVSPSLYGEKNTSSYCDPARDEYETSRYMYAKTLGIPMVGICRGGQFLNVMNGGKMIQHIGPFSGDVKCIDDEGQSHVVRVDHHQGIVRKNGASVSILAKEIGVHPVLGPGVGLTYACYYDETSCLCFQPHPEWGHDPTRKLFFQLIEEYL